MLYQFVLLIFVFSLTDVGSSLAPPTSVRVAVVKNALPPTPTHMAFTSNQGNLVMATSDDKGDTWTNWASPVATPIPLTSNPMAVSRYVPALKKTIIFVFMQSPNGQVTALVQSDSNPSLFNSMKLTSNLPMNLDPTKHSLDPVQAVNLKNQTFLFVRTQTNSSHLYWTQFDDLSNSSTPKFHQLGGSDDILIYDPCVAVNTFLERIEVFGVFDSGYVLHTWQDSPNSFYDGWKKLGGLFSPKFSSTPVAHQMGHSNFNGVLNLFVLGEDGNLHHIAQTTCDKVNNVWGPCTWGVFGGLGSDPPADHGLTKPFSATHSIHQGIEIFTVGKKKGHLYHLWQKERDSSYSDWEDLGPLSDSSPFFSSPALLFDEFGWWEAFALSSTYSLTRFREKPLKFALSTGQVEYGNNVTVTWAIPEDQATHMDWIGVYPTGAPGHGYVDFSYVGGTQNPLKDPIPQGSLHFSTLLPNGTYDYRYMVNKDYAAVFNDSVVVTGSPIKEEWVALFDGISLGLGSFNTNVSKCAEDGEHTVSTFKASFDAFENRKIYEGLHLFAEGLSDFRDALVQCNETFIIEELVKFIEDLVACTEDNCLKFAIDLRLELVILYEHIYEIYGDIQGATNSFNIKAYEQGGLCIGRVTYACLKLE